jgi:hypothetical protein
VEVITQCREDEVEIGLRQMRITLFDTLADSTREWVAVDEGGPLAPLAKLQEASGDERAREGKTGQQWCHGGSLPSCFVSSFGYRTKSIALKGKAGRHLAGGSISSLVPVREAPPGAEAEPDPKSIAWTRQARVPAVGLRDVGQPGSVGRETGLASSPDRARYRSHNQSQFVRSVLEP